MVEKIIIYFFQFDLEAKKKKVFKNINENTFSEKNKSWALSSSCSFPNFTFFHELEVRLGWNPLVVTAGCRR